MRQSLTAIEQFVTTGSEAVTENHVDGTNGLRYVLERLYFLQAPHKTFRAKSGG